MTNKSKQNNEIPSEKTKSKIKENKEPEIPEITFGDILDSIATGYRPDGTTEEQSIAKKKIGLYLKQVAAKDHLSETYNVVVLYDTSTMVKIDADSIYNAITSFTEKKPLLLALKQL